MAHEDIRKSFLKRNPDAEQYYDDLVSLSKQQNVDLGIAHEIYKQSNPGARVQAKVTEIDPHILMERRRIEALEAQKRRGLEALQSEREKVDPAFRTALSNVAGQSARQARSLAEYLAQRGQTQSGIAAQTEMQRLANLGTSHTSLEQQRADMLSDIARRESDVQFAYDEGALQAALERQIGQFERQEQLGERERAEAIATVGQYYGDYAKKIQEIEAMESRGDFSQSYLKPYLLMARQEKLGDMAEAEERAMLAEERRVQQEFENWYKMQTLRGRGGGSTGLTISEATKLYQEGFLTDEQMTAILAGQGVPFTEGDMTKKVGTIDDVSVETSPYDKMKTFTTNIEKGIINQIEADVMRGNMTETEAKKLLQAMGYKV